MFNTKANNGQLDIDGICAGIGAECARADKRAGKVLRSKPVREDKAQDATAIERKERKARKACTFAIRYSNRQAKLDMQPC